MLIIRDCGVGHLVGNTVFIRFPSSVDFPVIPKHVVFFIADICFVVLFVKFTKSPPPPPQYYAFVCYRSLRAPALPLPS